jgi:short-subunit dehydrogenase
VTDTALITGASAGIGAEFARRLADRGQDLVLVARREDRLRELADSVPTTAHVLACDLGADAASLPGRVAELGVDIDLLVNNAGFGSYGRVWEIDDGRDAEMVRVNCEAVVILTRAFLPGMVERGRGGVITIASMSAMQPLPYTATYAASKAFALRFSEAVNEELRGTGVRCLAVNPGPVDTEWSAIAGVDTSQVLPNKISVEQAVGEALAAYDSDKRSVIPGRAMRAFRALTAPSPRSLQLRIAERMYRKAGREGGRSG